MAVQLKKRYRFRRKLIGIRYPFYEWIHWFEIEKKAKYPSDWTNSDVPRFQGVLIFAQDSGGKRVYGYTLDHEFWALGDRISRVHIGGVTGTGRPYYGIRPVSVAPVPWKLEPTSRGGMHVFSPGKQLVVGPTSEHELELFAVNPGSNYLPHR